MAVDPSLTQPGAGVPSAGVSSGGTRNGTAPPPTEPPQNSNPDSGATRHRRRANWRNHSRLDPPRCSALLLPWSAIRAASPATLVCRTLHVSSIVQPPRRTARVQTSLQRLRLGNMTRRLPHGTGCGSMTRNRALEPPRARRNRQKSARLRRRSPRG